MAAGWRAALPAASRARLAPVLVALTALLVVTATTSALLDSAPLRWVVAAVAIVVGLALAAVGAAALREPVIRPLDAIASAAHAVQASVPHLVASPGALVEDVERSLRDSIEAGGDVEAAARETVEQGTILAVQVRSLMSRDLGDYPADWTVAAGLRPAEGLVAGDCYDVGLLSPTTIGLVVLDIAGHGALSAFAALRCKDLLKAGLRSGMDPGRTFGWLMEQDHGLDGTFLTGFIAVIDASTGVMRYASAGHPEGILRSGSEVTLLAPTGPILGPIASTWDTEEAVVPVGGSLVVYTDGLTEARDDQRRFYGFERLIDVVERIECSDAQPFVEHVLHDLDTFQPSRFTDDVTLVVACRLDPAAVDKSGCEQTESGTSSAMSGVPAERELDLPATTAAPRLGRDFVAAALAGWGLELLSDTAALLASEVVTNAVVHAKTTSTLRIGRFDGRVRVSVTDSGAGDDVARRAEPRPGIAGGHGLSLVETLAADWGAQRVDGNHEVWFDLDLNAGDTPSTPTVRLAEERPCPPNRPS